MAFILGYIVAYIAVVLFKVRPGRRGTMMNTFVNANTIFIGLPFKRCSFWESGSSLFLNLLYHQHDFHLDIGRVFDDE